MSKMEILQNLTETKARKEHRCDFCSLPIQKGETYLKSSIKQSDYLYTWKTHIHCEKIAGKLNMYDWADEGVTQDDFITAIQEEYMSIMSKTQTELYESNGFVYPKFREQLLFVLNHHNISI